MKKKALALLVIVFMIGTIVGCSSKESGSNGLPKELVIGALIPMTGTGASYGVMDKNGADLAVEQINANGGVQGIKLRMKYEDHEAKPAVAVNAINRLISVDKTSYVISSYSSIGLAVAPIGDKTKTVVINAGGQSDNLANAGDYFYNNIPLVGGEIEIIADYLVNDEGFKTAAIVFANDDGGRSSLDIFKREFGKHGGEVLAEEATELGGSDFRAALTKVKAVNPDVLFIGAYGQDTALIIKQARELGITSAIAETSWSVIPDVYTLPEAEGLIHTSLAFEPSGEFAAAYKEKYSEEPTLYAVTYYDGVKIFADSLNWVIENKKPINGESLKEAIDAIRSFEGAAGKVTFRDDHTTLKDVNISVLKNGTPETIKTFKTDN